MPSPALTQRIADLSRSALSSDRPDAAETFCRLGLILDPRSGVFRHHLGLIALLHDDVAAAMPHLEAAVAAFAEDASDAARDAHRDLAVAHLMAGEGAAALECGLAAERLWPEDPGIARVTAQAAEKVGDLDAAIPRYARALAAMSQADPKRAETGFALGTALYARRRLGEAYRALRAALDANRNHAACWCNLGNVLSDLARPAEAIKAYEAALAIDPRYRNAHSNALQTLHYLPGHSAQSLKTAHLAWARRHYPDDPPRPPAPPARSRLAVGLVSEDLRRHPVGYFCAGWLRHARAAGIDAIVYSSNRTDDDLTAELRKGAAQWREVADYDDAALARAIRRDAPDVLIDLGGHTGRNRLGTFAQRPAALQATWMGYVGTTGLAQIDGLIADRFHVPKLEDSAYVEDVWRMPNGYVCYAPPAYAPEPRSGAHRRNGFISFAAFHNPAKINPDLIAAWAKILHGVPDSRIRLAFRGFDEPLVRDFVERTFQAQGIAADRLDIRGALPHAELLALYDDCDFALDAFPYAGGLTTMEALWMGIPVVAAPGATFASRHAASHIANAGFAGEVASGPSDYVRTAIAWANAPAMRDADRAARRARMAASPACDGERFAADLMRLLHAACEEER
ncbi:putative TPR repeat-containing protein [uncultured Alphaproteobacteria bacterium]|uniref:protein O-GlcNAc transferase n=1 Tax=uncultured Alphaproteobacteria bacterium TaxID=91750 RepID=A0A212JPS5_9PROT|nr:putative TPR repeat-containing protein [uncultured Alphaproteobacteria bacterium]